MFDSTYFILAVFMGFLATYGARILPFLLFKRKKEAQLELIQKNMPLMIMVILVFYTLFGLDFSTPLSSLCALLACALALILQMLFKSALLSILLSTLFYMLISRLLA